MKIVEVELSGADAALYINSGTGLKILMLNSNLSRPEKDKIIKEAENQKVESWQSTKDISFNLTKKTKSDTKRH